MGQFDDEESDPLELQRRTKSGRAPWWPDILQPPLMRALQPTDMAVIYEGAVPPLGAPQPPSAANVCKILVPDKADRQAVLDRFNKYSTTQYEFDNNGYLQPSNVAPADAGPRSPTYSERIEAARNSPRTLTIDLNNRYSVPDPRDPNKTQVKIVDEQGGGVTVSQAHPWDARTTLTGRGFVFPQPGNQFLDNRPEDIQMHEVATHGAAIVASPPPGISAIDLENKIRAELGRPLRAPEPLHGYFEDRTSQAAAPAAPPSSTRRQSTPRNGR